MMNKRWKKLSVLAAALVVALGMVCTVAPTTGQAASTKKVTAAKTYQKAPSLKTGNNTVSSANSSPQRIVKYTAKSKGTYVFTFSKFKSVPTKSKDINLGFVSVNKLVKSGSSKGLNVLKVQTNKGKTSYLNVATSYSYNHFYKNKGSGVDNYLYSRKATVSMKKGQTLYFKTFFTGGKHSYSVNIKKK